ncbi:MAG: response regulator [Gammaproteobacteria bacterium]|nr:response regulator [Gammaproteobacteria bacterium]
MNVLIVDDSRAMRMIVKKTLKEAGYSGLDITEAEDGSKALDLIKSDTPDLVLSDWNMPNMNGIELLEALKDEGIKLTFGFVTTEATTEMRNRATDGGAKFLISKPFTVDSFKESLDKYLG